MIPKIIHYCWFGNNPKPEMALKCIASWKKHLPDYTIKEWNEANFDLSIYPYAQEAYDRKKFAFVADVARLHALYHEGGIYMDTDVEVIQSLDPFLHHHAFSGFEDEKNISTGIMASEKNGAWAKENLAYYQNRHFITPEGEMDLRTNVYTITHLMLKHGLKTQNSYQDFPGFVTFYPKDYFCPLSVIERKLELTKNTVVIHHFAGSWSDYTPFQKWAQKMKSRIIAHLPRFFVTAVLDYKEKKRQAKFADERMKR